MKKTTNILASTVISGTMALQGTITQAQSNEAIRPYQVRIPEAALQDLRNRINDTRWPDKETVSDQSQGAQLARLQKLVKYWGSNYNWKRVEAKLNSYPQFITTIDGVDIHFIHVRSKEKNALPMIISHGWPGSVVEMLKVIEPLTNPVAYGGKAEDAFDVIIPSLPGFGFSGRPTEKGWDPDRIAKAWAVLMNRLGYMRYVAQGGDWGAGIVNSMGRQMPRGLLGIHNNLPATLPLEVDAALGTGSPAPATLSIKELTVFNDIRKAMQRGDLTYIAYMGARPQAVGYGITDSPTGLAAWLLQHPGFSLWAYGDDPNQSPTVDDVLDDISVYWLTNTAASSARIYWENKSLLISASGQKTSEIKIPVAITVFPEDVYRAPETWARRAYPNLTYFNEVDKGGHFAAWEQPQLFTEEMRAAFRGLR